ncbi:claudin-34-like [Pipistrellus kuhlii]|uniref:claudin-34-like n=1 Tax=Pipistrellus kuhlii TaxID=59472 RepID=UPI00174F1B00|nr:claudin-34-like [Pipistrellus kuhlii]
MVLFDKANCLAVSFALNILGWIFTMVSMGLPNWRIWYIENSPSPSWGLACVGMWKVCTYQPSGLQTSPIACHRYTYSDAYLPLHIRFPQHLLLVAFLLSLLGKGLMVLGLRRVFVGHLQKDTPGNLFLAPRILSIIAGAFIAIAVLCNYHAVLNEEGIDFPPSFHIPYRPNRQEIGSTVYLAILAALLMLFSGLFTISFKQPPNSQMYPQSSKCKVPSCISLQIHDEQFMEVK